VTRDELLAERTAAWTEDERVLLGQVVAALRPSPRHLADVLDWLDDMAARDGTRPAAALEASTLRAALHGSGSPPDKLKRWKEALRRLRYPRLVAREQAFATAARALDLGHAVTIVPPAALEGGTVTVTIRAASAAELDAILDRLARARDAGEIAELFALLD
jgi:hypothetical protein